MSDMQWDKQWDYEEEIMDTAERTRDMLKSDPETTLGWIDHNAANKPKPHHHNRDMIHTLLKQEVTAQSFPLVGAEQGGEAFSCGSLSAEGEDWEEYGRWLKGEL